MKFYGELLVFAMLLITNLRVFFVKQVRRDPLVVLAPFTFTISILQVFAFGIDFITALGVFIGLLVLLSNFHAIFRYFEKLYIDHYSILMKVWAVFTVTLCVLAAGITIYFAPVEVPSRKLKIAEFQMRYKGRFADGFKLIKPFEKANAVLTCFSPNFTPKADFRSLKNIDRDKIIIFFPDKRGDTANYVPYLQQLALENYTVFSIDYFADDCRWMHSKFEDLKISRRISIVARSYLNDKIFASQREFYNYNIKMEIGASIKLIDDILAKLDGDGGANDGDNKVSTTPGLSKNQYYLVCDWMGKTSLDEYQKKYPEKIRDIFLLDSVEQYKTPGYGVIEETDPFLATLLGSKRDSAFSTSKMLALKTSQKFGGKNDIK